MIRFEDVTKDNFIKVIKLWDTLDEDQKTSVASNTISLAQAYVESDYAWPKTIYYDNELVGFIMIALTDPEIPDEDQPSYYLWRFMIGKDYQGMGYGREAVKLLINKCKQDNQKYLYLSCTMDHEMPYKFYLKLGFVDTGLKDADEQILKIKI